MCELEAQAMHDAEAAAHLAHVMNTIDAFFGPALQRARDTADKIHRANEMCREAEKEGDA